MESDDGYLCDLCSEIYRYGGELIDHMMEDHDRDNFVICEFSKSDNNNYISHDDKIEDECVDSLPDIPYHLDNHEDDPDYIPDFEQKDTKLRKTPNHDASHEDREKLSIKEIVERNSVLLSPNPGNDRKASIPNTKKRGRKPHPPRLYYCENCDYKTKIKFSMKSHLLTHTLDCPFCPFKTVRQDNYLSQHIKKEHLDSKGALKKQWLTGDGDNNVPWHRRQFFMVDIANNPKLRSSDDPQFAYLRHIPDGRQRLVFKGSDVELAQSAHGFLSSNGALTN